MITKYKCTFKYNFLIIADAIWRTELDVFVEKDIIPGSIEVPSYSNTTPPMVSSDGDIGVNQWEVLSPEFVNYIIALVIFSIRYPSVFWYTNMAFSLVFSLQLLMATVFYAFAFCGMSLLYKFQLNSNHRPDMKLILPEPLIILLYLVSNIFVYFSSIAIFNYGYNHYDEAYKKALKARRQLPQRPSSPPTGCQGYVPHTLATVALVLFVACRAPLVYDCVTLYRGTKHPISLASIVWDVCYMFIWIIMWFCFTLKQKWNFKVKVDKRPHQRAEVYMIRADNTQDSVVTVNGPLDTLDGEMPYHTQNGNAISVATSDSTPSPIAKPLEQSMDSAPSSPTSALRKSGERKHNNARVTFEDPAQSNPVDNDIVLQEPPRRRPRERGRTTPQGSPGKKRKRKPDLSPPNKPEESGANHESQDKPASVFGNFKLEDTPENTLTRNYRHSIRDKCGQYYRHSREFKSPPAAQSSPVLAPRTNKNQGKKPEVRPPSQDIRPPRRPSPVRTPGGGLDKPRHPSPVRTPTGRHTHGETVRPSSGIDHIRNPVLAADTVKHANSVDQIRHPKFLQSNTREHSNVGFPRRPPKPAQGALNISHSADHLPMKHHTNRDLSRELRIVTNSKPEMGRRDSALPSSNETSSNDSTDNVLCSQV